MIADRGWLTPNVDAGLPHITEGAGELIRRVKHGVGSEEGAQLAACPTVRVVDVGAWNAASHTGGRALRC